MTIPSAASSGRRGSDRTTPTLSSLPSVLAETIVIMHAAITDDYGPATPGQPMTAMSMDQGRFISRDRAAHYDANQYWAEPGRLERHPRFWTRRPNDGWIRVVGPMGIHVFT